MAIVLASCHSFEQPVEHYIHEYSYPWPHAYQHKLSCSYPEEVLLPQSPPIALAALPDAGHFPLKHTTSDLNRIDSGFSLNHYDTASSTRSVYEYQHRSPSLQDLAAVSPDHFPDFHQLDLEDRFMLNHQTIAMPEIQGIADSLSDPSAIDLDLGLCSMPLLPEEGYQPLNNEEAIGSPGSSHFDGGLVIHNPHTRPVESPVLRQRQSAARANTTRQTPRTSRVSRRNAQKRAISYASPDVDSDNDIKNDRTSSTHARVFHCPLAPYGCESTFGSKNEWKRHFSTQHLRLEYWRCDQCPSKNGKGPNDFNRRDLFTQHVRRMHQQSYGPTRKDRGRGRGRAAKSDDLEAEVAAAAERCYRRLRSPPTKSICIICRKDFKGHSSWDERMEHLGKHFENAKKDASDNQFPLDVGSWAKDEEVEQWMIEQRILTPDLTLGKLVEESEG